MSMCSLFIHNETSHILGIIENMACVKTQRPVQKGDDRINEVYKFGYREICRE